MAASAHLVGESDGDGGVTPVAAAPAGVSARGGGGADVSSSAMAIAREW